MDNKKLNYEIKPTSFNFVNSSNKIADKKLDTKPTSFAKDAFKRFCKNKSSVVAFFVLGIIILLAIFVPVFSPYNTKRVSATEKFLAPKLFESVTGFWDGCVKYEKKVNLDGSISGVLYDTETGGPAGYRIDAVKDLVVDKEPTYINQAVAYGKDGYVIFENQNQKTLGNDSLISLPFTVAKDGEYTLTINLNDTEGAVGGSLGEYRVQFVENTTDSPRVITIRDWSTDYSSIENYNLSSALEQLDANLSEMEGYLSFELKAKSEAYSYILLESVVISSQNADETTAARLAEISFTDATKMVLKTKPLEGDSSGAFIGYWTATGRKGIFKSEVFYCTFIYDTYAAVYGEESMVVSRSDLKSWVDAGY